MSKKTKKKELGKGIRALLGSMEDQTQLSHSHREDAPTGDHIQLIALSSIEANPDQPRRGFDQETLEELAKSIKTFGLIQPVTVRVLSKDRYQIISGERRWRASQIAGLTEIPAYIRTANDQELLEMGLVENIQREDLNALDIAISYQRLIDECHLTHEDLSDRIGKKRSTITNYVRLLKLPPELQKALKKELITMGHARALAGIDRIEQQLMLGDQVIRHTWSVRKLESEIKNLGQPKANRPHQNERSPELAKIENNLKQFFGAKVKIDQKTSGRGSIKIDFSSSDQLNDILEMLEDLE